MKTPTNQFIEIKRTIDQCQDLEKLKKVKLTYKERMYKTKAFDQEDFGIETLVKYLGRVIEARERRIKSHSNVQTALKNELNILNNEFLYPEEKLYVARLRAVKLTNQMGETE